MLPITRNNIPFLLFYTFFCLFFICNTLKAQCIANAGEDSTICIGIEGVESTIGGTPSAFSGTPPYQYIWETNYNLFGTLFTASDFLNDTTLANPDYISTSTFIEELVFMLTVVDATGNVCVDSVTVDFSRFIYSITDHFAYISPDDSIGLLSSVSGGIPPLSYSWQPSDSLSNPNIENPIAFPDTTTFYT